MRKVAATAEERAENANLWRNPVFDSNYSPARSVQEKREHSAAEVFIKGQRWYARRLLELQPNMGRKLMCRTLLACSRKLIEQSRQAILRSENTLAFSRKPHKRLM